MSIFNRINLLCRKLWWTCPKDTSLKPRLADVQYAVHVSGESGNVDYAEIIIKNNKGKSRFKIVESTTGVINIKDADI